MTKREFEEWFRQTPLFLQGRAFVTDDASVAPFTIGCVQQADGRWKVYENQERNDTDQLVYLVGEEGPAFDKMQRLVLREQRYASRRDPEAYQAFLKRCGK